MARMKSADQSISRVCNAVLVARLTMPLLVIPAKAGIQQRFRLYRRDKIASGGNAGWIPLFAGMTNEVRLHGN
jgi:hypothetical protein